MDSIRYHLWTSSRGLIRDNEYVCPIFYVEQQGLLKLS